MNRNAGLLSFEADTEADATLLTEVKLQSAHDVLNDSRLSKEVRDDRGFSANLPDSLKNMPVASSSKAVCGT